MILLASVSGPNCALDLFLTADRRVIARVRLARPVPPPAPPMARHGYGLNVRPGFFVEVVA